MLKDNQISIVSAKDINEICQPLFKNSKISHFEFMRVFPDRSSLWLTSNAGFIKKLSAMNWSDDDKKQIDNAAAVAKGYYLWNDHDFCSRRLLILQEFNIDHGLSVKESYKSHQDYFIFGTQEKNHKIHQFCFNNIDFISKFIFCFKDKSSLLIKKAMTEKLHLPRGKDLSNKFLTSLANSENPSDNIKIDKYIFSLADKVISLSTQEFNSIKLLARGFTIKEAAKNLRISPRTIEYYIKCAREKMNLKKNRDLISVYWQSTLAQLD